MTAVTGTAWIIFIISITSLLILDLGVFNRKAHVIKPKEALIQVAFFIGAAIVFNIGIYLSIGSQAGLEFTTGYLMELMLSVDNLFIIILIFGSFCVPAKDQHKVLFWGILGALGFRLAFILVGVSLVESFEWILYIFGAFLVITGLRMAIKKEKEKVEPEHNVMVRFFRRFLPVTKDYEGDKFFVRKPNGKGKVILWATPMFITLLVVETTDIVFAVDSIPAILGITTSTFIVFSFLGMIALARHEPVLLPQVRSGRDPHLRGGQDAGGPLRSPASTCVFGDHRADTGHLHDRLGHRDQAHRGLPGGGRGPD